MTKKKHERPLPHGTYWDSLLERYIEPTDPLWSPERFSALVTERSDASWSLEQGESP
jgi:hypothetical protein